MSQRLTSPPSPILLPTTHASRDSHFRRFRPRTTILRHDPGLALRYPTLRRRVGLTKTTAPQDTEGLSHLSAQEPSMSAAYADLVCYVQHLAPTWRKTQHEGFAQLLA